MIEVLLMISNPDDFVSWPDDQKMRWYARALEWHDHIDGLHSKGHCTQAWGSHQLLSRSKFVKSLGLRVAVVCADSWAEYDDLMLSDPLRDCSQYVTVPLTPLFTDYENDLARFKRAKKLMRKHRDSFGQFLFAQYRGLFSPEPDYVGKYKPQAPKNPVIDIHRKEEPGDQIEVLLLGVNPDELVTMWDDTRQFIHYERVMWWHDYMAMMIEEGKVTHGWGTHDFCHIESTSGNSAAAAAIYRVNDYDEFDDLYELDPIRRSTIFWSVLLKPLADQKVDDQGMYHRAKKRASSP